MSSILTIQNARVLPALFCVIWLLFSAEPIRLAVEYGLFTFLGVIGAIFANSTGAGGGVVFVPFFNQLEFSSVTTVATSFAIQCCGMTAGALTWWAHYRNLGEEKSQWQALSLGLWLTVPFSLLGIWTGQLVQFNEPTPGDSATLHMSFGVFSIFLALALFATVSRMKKNVLNTRLQPIDHLLLPFVALMGGLVTAYLSVGVGELIAVYLIMRGFNASFAIALAVILSAFSVWGGVLYHAVISNAIYWPVVLFAGIGAVLGGSVAKYLTLYFSPRNLKLFFAGWVLMLGVATLPT